MKKLKFVTSNKYKVREIQNILDDFDIELEQIEIDYPEDKEDDMEAVAKKAAKDLAEELGEAVIVEDSGLYFDAYNNFPGAQPKFVFNAIGFDGIFRLLKDKDRGAYFETVIGYCEPGKESVIFSGTMKGKIMDKVVNPEVDTMPYNHIIIPDGSKKTVAEMTLEEMNGFLQRAKAARKLGKFLQEK